MVQKLGALTAGNTEMGQLIAMWAGSFLTLVAPLTIWMFRQPYFDAGKVAKLITSVIVYGVISMGSYWLELNIFPGQLFLIHPAIGSMALLTGTTAAVVLGLPMIRKRLKQPQR